MSNFSLSNTGLTDEEARIIEMRWNREVPAAHTPAGMAHIQAGQFDEDMARMNNSDMYFLAQALEGKLPSIFGYTVYNVIADTFRVDEQRKIFCYQTILPNIAAYIHKVQNLFYDPRLFGIFADKGAQLQHQVFLMCLIKASNNDIITLEGMINQFLEGTVSIDMLVTELLATVNNE